MRDQRTNDLDMRHLLATLGTVMDRLTMDTKIGRILMPGASYLGIWARDTGVSTPGLNRLGKSDLAGDLLRRYWSFQITSESDPDRFVFRNKRFPGWTEADAFRPTRKQLLAEVGALPTSVYIDTPDFPAGTRELYGNRADLDSTAWLIIALHDYYCHTGDGVLLRELAPNVERAVAYLRSRDVDGDHLLEQGPNEDWADTLLRHGKVAYTQAVWFRALEAADRIFAALGDEAKADDYRLERQAVRWAVNRTLLTRHGYYANFVASDAMSLHRSLDTALLVAFGISGTTRGRRVLTLLNHLQGPFGVSVVEPAYAPSEIGPGTYFPGQYQNEGIWPWITSYLALARAKVGDPDRARNIVCSLFQDQPDTIYEWIDNLTGEPHHADFATAAGALAWAITEGGLARRDRSGTRCRAEPPHALRRSGTRAGTARSA